MNYSPRILRTSYHSVGTDPELASFKTWSVRVAHIAYGFNYRQNIDKSYTLGENTSVANR
jgi:hypothetical protein